MSLRKFGPDDIILNTMRTYPPVKFFIYSGSIYYNSLPNRSGTVSDNLLSVTGGALSLYEYNVDRASDRGDGYNSDPIYPFIVKSSAGEYIRTIQSGGISSDEDYANAFNSGDVIAGIYPLTAAISREYMAANHSTAPTVNRNPGAGDPGSYNKHYYALKNRLNHYAYLSEHFKVMSSYEDGWDKSIEPLNLISIPSIFYGSRIREGSVSLKWYVTGTLAGELRDTKRNGELIQVGGTREAMVSRDIPNGTGLDRPPDPMVAGVVMYNEGFILLTGSWSLCSDTMKLIPGATATNPAWVHFAAGAQEGTDAAPAAASYLSASFEINFEGQNDTQVYTMFAKARRGEANYSNNPTFVQSGSSYLQLTNSYTYEENTQRRIKNTVSSSYPGYNAPFKRQVFISRVAIYDDSKNLIGVATLADPILKQEEEEYTFKIKLDI
jgi:hypothetical protein